MIVGRKVRFDELFLYFCLPALYSPSINLSLSPIFRSTRTTSSSSNFWYCWLLLPTVCCCNFIRQPARILRLSSWMAFMFKAIMQFLYRCCVWNFTFYRVVHLMTFHLTISLKATSYLIWVFNIIPCGNDWCTLCAFLCSFFTLIACGSMKWIKQVHLLLKKHKS